MGITYILYNPLAGSGTGQASMEKLRGTLSGKTAVPQNVTELTDYAAFLAGVSPDDEIIVCGGDGTLNRFVNDTDGMTVPCDVLYYAAGSGNDFLTDLGRKPGCAPFSVKEYITDLPRITVNGRSSRFLNCVGLGLDGYACAEVARAKAKGKKKSYVAVAIAAFLRDFCPVNATVTVDGEEHRYEKVWLVPTMKGRFFGGGVMAAPNRDRREKNVTVLWMHGVGRLKALLRFPTFLSGKHLKYTKMICCHTAKTVHVKFDRPTDLQIDGEPVENVTEYTVEA